MIAIQRPSPNCDSREGQGIDMLVLHYTGMKSASEALERLCNPTAKVSGHYMVDEDGTIYQLVDEEKRAWHAGVSYWRGHSNINQRSIGIEIVNPGHEFGYRAFPKMQMEAVMLLCKDILARHAIPARNVVAHSDVAPQRKEDPGELFDWHWLAQKGIGAWPSTSFTDKNVSLHNFTTFSEEKKLVLYGYDTFDLPSAIIAFQRHFHPQFLDGVWNKECEIIIESLLAV